MKTWLLKLVAYFSMFLFILIVSKNKHIAFRHTNNVKEITKINNENLSYKRIKYELDQKKKPYFNNNLNKINILVMGDSHSIDILNSLKQYEIQKPDNFEIKYQFLNETCLIQFVENKNRSKNSKLEKDKTCKGQINLLLNSENIKKSDIIVYSIYWTKFLPSYILEFNNYIKNKEKKIVFMGPNANFKKRPYEIIFKSNSINQANSFAFQNLDKNSIDIEKKLRSFLTNHQIPFISKIVHICPEFENKFKLFFENKRLSFMDTNHWTIEGATYFGQKIFGKDIKKLMEKIFLNN